MLSKTEQAILDLLQEHGRLYGLDIGDRLGLRIGTIYTTLKRLENAGYIRGEWGEEVIPGLTGNRRRYYELCDTKD